MSVAPFVHFLLVDGSIVPKTVEFPLKSVVQELNEDGFQGLQIFVRLHTRHNIEYLSLCRVKNNSFHIFSLLVYICDTKIHFFFYNQLIGGRFFFLFLRIWNIDAKKRNLQPATFGGNKSEKLISFCLAHIGRLLLTLHEKKKTTPEKEWVYPELGFMSCGRGVTKHYGTKVDIFPSINK